MSALGVPRDEEDSKGRSSFGPGAISLALAPTIPGTITEDAGVPVPETPGTPASAAGEWFASNDPA